MITNKYSTIISFWLLIFISLSLHAETVLRLSHQWPENTGDLRHRMAQLIQAELENAKIGVRLEITSKEKLSMRPWQQWSAMTSDKIDMSIYPLAYAGPSYPLFNLTLMPGIIKNHEHAKRFNQSKVMDIIKKVMNNAGVLSISDLWLAGGIVSKNNCIAEPDDTKGLWMRAAGITYNQMLVEAGAQISSMPSSNIRPSMQKDELDGAITSSASLVSYKIYTVAKCLLAPDETAIWFMYEPILISKSSFNKLSKKQQQALISAGKKAEEFGFIEAKKADKTLVEVYNKHGVTVKKLTYKQFMKWRNIAEKSSYKLFKKDVRNGEELLTWALEVE